MSLMALIISFTPLMRQITLMSPRTKVDGHVLLEPNRTTRHILISEKSRQKPKSNHIPQKTHTDILILQVRQHHILGERDHHFKPVVGHVIKMFQSPYKRIELKFCSQS